MQNALFDTEEYSHGYNVSMEEEVLHVVEAITTQNPRGAWTVVVANRIARSSTYTKREVETTIKDMLNRNLLFISAIENYGVAGFEMVYVKTSRGEQ